MAGVKVLISGVHRMTADETVEVWCTTTLIKSQINIIVDPGSYINHDRLIKALELENLKPSDIHALFLTHTHIDHTTNMYLFPQAKIYSRLISGEYKGQYQMIETGLVYRFDLLTESITTDVQVIETPGHSIDSATLLVETAEGVTAVCGDAIANESFANLDKLPEKFLVYDMDKYNESRKKILSAADWVIPGHGEKFKLTK
jgi:glyoxylase-like metal-dependent hydrolase (beta-lactamase superfamily II)